MIYLLDLVKVLSSSSNTSNIYKRIFKNDCSYSNMANKGNALAAAPARLNQHFIDS